MASTKTARQRATARAMGASRRSPVDGGGAGRPAASAEADERAEGAGGRGGALFPRWPSVSGLVLSLAGLAISAYLTFDHFAGVAPAACPENAVVNCAKVTTSAYSAILGIPVAVLGLVFFAVMVVLQLPRMWSAADVRIRWARMAWAIIGVGTALWLVYAELFEVNAICIYCTSVHALTLIVFGTTAVATAMTADA